MIRSIDWASTPLGAIATWPAALKSALGLALASPLPLAILWGPEGTLLYNDAYAEFSAERHPHILGLPARDAWPEAAAFNENVLRVGLEGRPLAYRDIPFTLDRRGYPEPLWFDLTYSPIPDEHGRPAGVLAVVIDTTSRVLSEQGRVRVEAELRRANDQIDLATEAGTVIGSWTWDETCARMIVDSRLAETLGVGSDPTARGLTVADLQAAVHETERPKLDAAIRRSLHHGGLVRTEFRLRDASGAYRWVEAIGRNEPAAAGQPGRHSGVLLDIEARVASERARRESEARFRHMADSAPALIWMTDETGAIIFANMHFGYVFGQEPDALFADGWDRFVHPDDRGRVRTLFGAALRSREPFRADVRFIDRRGDTRWFRCEGVPRLNDAQEFLGFTGCNIDVTDSREAEIALRESEERFRAITNSAPIPIWVSRLDGTREFVNEAYTAFLGLDYDGSLALDWRERIHPDDLATTLAGQIEGEGSVRPFTLEMRMRRADGEWRWIRSESQPRFDPAGRHVGFIGVGYDVTLARRAAADLRSLNETLERRVDERTRERDRIWTLSQDAFLVADREGRWLSVSPAWTAMLGWSPDELVGRTSDWLEHPDDARSTDREIAQLRAGEPTTRFENRLRHRDGSYRWLAWTAVPEGGLLYCVARDVTAEKAAAAELEAAQTQLRQAQKMEAIGQLTGGIAHDFNNLLTGIVGSLDLLQSRLAKGETEKLGRYVEAATSSANRAAALTHRLLAFARRQPLDSRPIDTNALVASLDDLLRRTLGETIELELDPGAGLPPIVCDPNQLENALLNLAINARDAMPEGGRVSIGTALVRHGGSTPPPEGARPGAYVVVTVADTGHGMPPEVLARAFDPFFTTKPAGQGTGLGLSMIYGFARQSDGFATIESAPGAGTSVSIHLPARLDQVAAAPPRPRTSAAAPTGRGELVLLVEDEPVVRDIAIEILSELGFRTIVAVDGPSGLAAIESDQPIDIMITDIGLPGLSGRVLADRARERRPALKVLLMTGYADREAFEAGVSSVGLGLITKPFSVEAFQARVRDLVAAGPARPA